jgi:phage shock protein PspC (stress-responsive transcriptional regulator)
MESPQATRPDPLSHHQRRARRPSGAEAPLRRSERGWIAGVCGGIAAFTGARPAAVRTIWLLSLIPSLGITALAYPMLWLLLPGPVRDATPDRNSHR